MKNMSIQKRPYANPAEDYKKVFNFISEKKYNKNLNSISPPFWGNMLSLILQKNKHEKKKLCCYI